MKAIRKSDGKEIEITLLNPRQYLSTDEEYGVVRQTVYYEDGLILEEPVDWNAFRREAAKDIMCAVLSVPGMWEETKYDGLAAACIKQADELITQLKDEPKKGL